MSVGESMLSMKWVTSTRPCCIPAHQRSYLLHTSFATDCSRSSPALARPEESKHVEKAAHWCTLSWCGFAVAEKNWQAGQRAGVLAIADECTQVPSRKETRPALLSRVREAWCRGVEKAHESSSALDEKIASERRWVYRLERTGKQRRCC